MDLNSSPSTKPSVASLLAGIICDAKELFAYELRSAKLEVENVVDQAVRASTAVGIGLGIIGLGVLLLFLMLVYALNAHSDIPLWGCYGIVGSLVIAAGALWLIRGVKSAHRLAIMPHWAENANKEDAQWISQRTMFNRAEKKPAPH
jgi:hypothetical protein